VNSTNSYPLRVLVVDGSADDRKKIVDVLASALDVEVVGEAGDGDEALHLAAALRPNLVTLELDMPKMDRFTFLRILMSRQPTPVIVVRARADQTRPRWRGGRNGPRLGGSFTGRWRPRPDRPRVAHLQGRPPRRRRRHASTDSSRCATGKYRVPRAVRTTSHRH
jgi:CheY-like chemotaxis protein